MTSDPLDLVRREELRLALVLNGGVSLAVWMGGVAHELDALVRARRPGSAHHDAYGPVLALTRTFANVDVISGTSAGGINGAALAVSLANQNGRLGVLRDLWAEQGRMDNLLRTPFRGQPTSLLRGDEYFLPELTKAMRGLVTGFVPVTDYSVDLTITTTLLGGATTITTDGLGQSLPQRRHGANFRFSTKHLRSGHNDFDEQHIGVTCDALGLAARCTAGFPFAFEPTFVPVETPARGQSAPARAEIGGRPNMWRWASWAERSRADAEYPEQVDDLSRYAADGGLLANTPTREALDAIDRRPAGKPLRRAMLLVFPHAPTYDPSADEADKVAEAPTVAGAVGGLLGSLTSQGSLTFVEEIDAHNRRAAGWRGGRERLLEAFSLGEMYQLVETGWRFYGATRIQAAARSLSERVPRPDGWDYGRVVAASAEGQRTWRARNDDTLPYVPKVPILLRRYDAPDAPEVPDAIAPRTPGWGWGTTVALGVADAAAAMLFAAQSLVREPRDAARLDVAMQKVSDARDAMLAARDEFDDWWWHQPAFGPVAPDEEYWALRLDCYHRAMQDGTTPAPPDSRLADAVGRLRGHGRQLTDAERAEILAALTDTTRPNPLFAADETLGTRTSGAVMDVVAVVAAQEARLRAVAPLGDDIRLTLWDKVLDDRVLDGEPERRVDRMLTRLLTLDAATWMLADAESTGTSQAVNLAQLSLVIQHPAWAEKSRTPDEKVAGTELNRFGGFLKQSWRINDWIWGRLDAAQMLCRLVLEPERLHRIHLVTGLTAEDVVARLLQDSYGDIQGPAELEARRRAAVTELNEMFNGRLKDRGYLPELAGLAAYPIQQRIIVAELPALARAVEEDKVAGGNRRSRGAAFLRVEKELLKDLADGGPDLWRTHGTAALRAFDRAGIGREPLDEESRSDAMIKTAVTAAATLVTVADGDRLGPQVLKPLTKTVRGAALVPYWLVTGLLSGPGVARTLGLLGFAAGGLALLLGLFGVLGAFSAAATTVGAGVVVGALAYAALRSGTLLHGAVLLGAAVPLITLAAPVMREVGASDVTAKGSFVSLTTVVVIVLGLMLLASLPNPVRSPAAVLGVAWEAVRSWLSLRRGVLAVLGVAVLAGLVYVGWRLWTAHHDKSWFDDLLMISGAVVSAVALVVGAVTSWRRARGMRRWSRATDGTWRRDPQVTASSGVSAGWAAVYGACFLVLAWIALLVLAYGDDELADASTWQGVVVAWWAVLGVILCAAGPTWITWRARRQVERAIIGSGRSVSEGLEDGELLTVLESRGQLFDYLVGGEAEPTLTAHTRALVPLRRHDSAAQESAELTPPTG
jgi:patatin-related protein